MSAAQPGTPLDRGGVAGENNSITDISGIRVGHATRIGDGRLTGTTAVLLPPGTVTAVDVRGGAPSTRDTAALDVRHDLPDATAFVLTGGSVYGLSAAHGVLTWLAEHDTGFDPRCPVPAAALFDLGRGGEFHAHPGAETGAEAVELAAASPDHAMLAQGDVGAGTGAVNAEMKGGIGTASALLPGGVVVAALAAVNAHGPSIDPDSGLPYAGGIGVSARQRGAVVTDWPEFPLEPPSAATVSDARRHLAETVRGRATVNPLNTVIGVVATNARLSRAQSWRLADRAHDGIALAVRPSHGIADGDTIFAAATGELPERAASVDEIIAAAAEVFGRAMVHGVLSARSVTTGWGHIAAYRDLFPGVADAYR